jgi:hypothetical protein
MVTEGDKTSLTAMWIPAKLSGISTHQPLGAQRRANSTHLGCGCIRSVAKLSNRQVTGGGATLLSCGASLLYIQYMSYLSCHSLMMLV